jgi:hypothetical protein
VRAAGGNFAAGPGEAGGYLVEAWLPARAPAPARQLAPARHLAPDPTLALGSVLGPGRLRGLVVAGAVAGTTLLGCGFGWYAYSRSHSVLDAGVYASARLGTPYAQLAPRLPARTVGDVPVQREPARPAGASCRYYRAVPGLFVSVDHYRLCFKGGRLVAKTVVPGAGAAGDARREIGELGG